MFSVALVNITDTAFVPKRSDPGAAGYDVFSRIDTILAPGQRQLIPTGIALEIPSDHYGRIAPRSGLANGGGIHILGGVIDSSYRGEVKVILINFGIETVNIRSGDRIAQLIFEKISTPNLNIVSYEALTSSARGIGGFGSSGK